ncbi:MarR family transcriptional regulator [Rhodobacterales bacterium HKCCE4037]|nr:MarR family transcriptional regulator [Rhodobacterales bacterium HKCCE4037]
MTNPDPSNAPASLDFGTGTAVNLGWLARDLPFLTRTLRFLLRPDSDSMRQELGLDPGEIGVLAIVGQNEGISQNGLADSLVLKKSAVTKIVQAIEKRGLIERRRSESDRRSNELFLTVKGKAVTDRMQAATAALQDIWFEGIPAAERAVFFKVLFGIVEGLVERGVEGGPDED